MSRARDLLGHQISPRHTVPGMCTFPLRRPESIRKLLATPLCYYCASGCILSRKCALCHTGTKLGKCFLFPSSSHSTFGRYECQPPGRTRSAQLQLDLLAGCIQSAHCVFSNGVLDLVLVVTVPVSLNCEHGTAQGQPSRKASAGNA